MHLRIAIYLVAVLTCVLGQQPATAPTTADANSANPSTTTTANPSTAPPETTPASTTQTGKTDPATTAASTTPPAPTTTAAPTQAAPTNPPIPEKPDIGSYTLKNATTGNVCVMVNVAMQLTIPYVDSKGDALNSTFNLPTNATVNATIPCASSSATEQEFQLLWNNDTLVVTFMFENSKDGFSLNALRVDVIYTDEFFPDSSNETEHGNFSNTDLKNDFKVPKTYSYKCVSNQTIHLSGNAKATVSSFQFDAFISKSKAEYDQSQLCAADYTTNDIVPIAVGCALAALVVIVLIAYLIGRRRSRQKGYQSV